MQLFFTMKHVPGATNPAKSFIQLGICSVPAALETFNSLSCFSTSNTVIMYLLGMDSGGNYTR